LLVLVSGVGLLMYILCTVEIGILNNNFISVVLISHSVDTVIQLETFILPPLLEIGVAFGSEGLASVRRGALSRHDVGFCGSGSPGGIFKSLWVTWGNLKRLFGGLDWLWLAEIDL